MRKAWGIARTGMLENWKGSQYGWGSQARVSKKHSDLKGREEPDRVGHLRSVKGFGEGNGNPLQCSCLENPRDGGAWWAAIYGVVQSRTRLKRLSSSKGFETSVVVQWLRICLPRQGTEVQSLVWQYPMCQGAAKPMQHGYWPCALEPVLCGERSRHGGKPLAATRESPRTAVTTQSNCEQANKVL